MISHQRNTNAHAVRPPLPLLISLCSNIRGVGVCGEGFASSSLLLFAFRRGLRQTVCSIVTELTRTLPRCRPPTQTECDAPRRPLEISSELTEDSGINAAPPGRKKSSQWGEETYLRVVPSVKSVNSINLANVSKTGTATADSHCRWRRHDVKNRGKKKQTVYSFMAPSCVDLMFLSPCLYVSVCVHASATKEKNETAYEKKRKPGSSSCAC